MQWWQILLLTLYSGWVVFDDIGPMTGLQIPVSAGLISGLIMGDVGAGLLIGGSMQLMVLGIGTPGGASRIDAQSGAILGTAFSVALHMPTSLALTTIAVPVAALLVYTDILGRMANTFFVHKIDTEVEKENYSGIEHWFLAGTISWCLSRMVPVFCALAFGSGLVTELVKVLTGDLKWLGDGLTLAGGVLPAVGFAILLRFLPSKKHVGYLILGFTITTLLATVYTNIQTIGGSVASLSGLVKGFTSTGTFNALPMLAVALIAGALAYLNYQHESANKQQTPTAESKPADEDTEGEIEDDEY
ncbi:MAG: PTS sugar transporter subunit IIC [Streptococcaceae bacterium]|jgi:PTS system mannose-specific IIC component|nr:PTS sugar transporter subunit IIC [Streptococcaceae bacterium]